MENIEVNASDAICLILQFLKENRLTNSLKTLQEEAQVSLNAVDSTEAFFSDILNGRWDIVLQQTNTLECNVNTMIALYEQIAIEMIETQENDVARQILHMSSPMKQLKLMNPPRYFQLEKMVQSSIFDSSTAYGGSTKQKKREDIVEMLKNEVSSAPPSRLLSLLGQSLKWQYMQGMIEPGTDYDLFRGAPREAVVERVDKIVRKSLGKIKFGKNSFPQCSQFSRDGHMLITGTKDGFVEVWDYQKCKLRTDLEYQAKDEFMMHEVGVTAIAFSGDGEMLATGSEDGKVKVWKISSGLCLRRFENAHSCSIHSICFSRDSTQLLTASFDHSIRIHGLKSGQTLKEFQGHESYVNSAIFSSNGSMVFSASCDGSIKIWNVKTTECIKTIYPPNASHGVEIDVLSVSPLPSSSNNRENLVVCTRTNCIFVVSLEGEVIQTFKSDAIVQEKETGNFVACAISPRKKWLYGLTDKGFLMCFSISQGTLEHSLHVSLKDVYGLSHHPHRNVIATFGNDGYVRLWRA